MMRRLRLFAAAPVLLVLATAYRLPPEPAISLGQGAEAELVATNCAACHSLDYITRQPPAMSAAFWTAEVTKMRTVYGAPVADADAARIAAFLAGQPPASPPR